MKVIPRALKTRRWCRPLSLLLLLAVANLQAEDEPPLPSWNVESPNPSLPTPGSNFSNLLPENNGQDATNPFYLGNPGTLNSPPLLLDDSGLNPQDLSLFLRGGLLNLPTEPEKPIPTPNLALKELPKHVLESLQGVPLNEYLIDPQSLITELPTLDLERLLQFHASEAKILLYVLVLDRDQKLSNISELAPFIERLHAGRSVCLAIYPLGEPWRARFLVSQAVQYSSSITTLTEMAEDCINDAMIVNDAERQLQRFSVKLSTRLFWLERTLTQVDSAPAEPAMLHEVEHKSAEAMLIPPERTGVNPQEIGYIIFLTLLGLAACYGLILAIRHGLKSSLEKKSKLIWLLPDVEIAPRLGGAFSGGAGAMIQYRRKTSGPRK